ncbi:unnamed protein product [Brassica rapa]|uniref:Uncharacterized protein n=1 Tax=Brassica campestris TaxID=3711 RepID=A0A3P5YVT7_BRACM|nr:unnamed protein product [Brassica rapa]VDC71049.1 unnamed protein product [Brassica rapa]
MTFNFSTSQRFSALEHLRITDCYLIISTAVGLKLIFGDGQGLMQNRADIMRALAWRVGCKLLDLPPDIQEKLPHT